MVRYHLANRFTFIQYSRIKGASKRLVDIRILVEKIVTNIGTSVRTDALMIQNSNSIVHIRQIKMAAESNGSQRQTDTFTHFIWPMQSYVVLPKMGERCFGFGDF